MDTEDQAIRTDRLLLTPAGPSEIEPMFALHSDPRVWSHLPSGRHADRTRTLAFLNAAAAQWRTDGLGYWVCRLAEQVGDLPAGEVVGMGGCAVPAGQQRWNLYYRFRPEAQGFGLVGELCSAALRAARANDPDRAVTAFLLEHNTASLRAAERAGLQLQWRGHDPGNPDPAAVRLVLADRALPPKVLASLTAPPP